MSRIASARAATDDNEVLTEAKVLRDPDTPVAGNPNGNVTIVEWSDYNCPYCRKLEPELRQVVQDDGKVRLVMKDWPILGPVSVTAARTALAAKFQDKYHQAHDALMGVSSRLTEPRINELLAAAGVDMDRLKRDLAGHWQRHRRAAQAQQRAGRSLRFQRHPVLHRRQVSRPRRAQHDRVRAGHRRCAQGQDELRRAASVAAKAKAPPRSSRRRLVHV
ncbi:protein-disulfide isomerase [Bradyrhizobium ottawaense]